MTGVKEWLSRSGACPLSISFVEKSRAYEESFGELYLDAIRPFAPRWRRLVLSGQIQSLDHFTTILLQEVPILEELAVIIDSSIITAPVSDIESNRWSYCGIIQAPSLNRVAITHPPEKIKGLQLRWSQMTHLSFELARTYSNNTLTPDETLEILRECPNLVSIQVQIGDDGGYYEFVNQDMVWQAAPSLLQRREAVIMHHLYHLSIHTTANLSQFFPLIQTPSLREFSFFGPPVPWLGVSSALLFLSSVANLKRLSVNPHCFTLDQLSDCLALCPIITSLRFCTGFVEDGWFSGPGLTTLAQCNEETMALITPSSEEGGGEYLCRCLENFQATTALFTAQTLYNFITARKQQARRGYPSLKTVRVSFDKPQDCDLLDALRDDTEITTVNPIAPPPVENYLRSIARYPPYSTTAESRVFHQLDLKLFSLPIS